jgi:hypothetical protein
MLLVAIEIPADPRAPERAAAITGLSLADVRNRLQGTLPRVLLSDADAERVSELSAQLHGLGFVTVACDPRAAPSDGERVVARSLRLESDVLVAVDGTGAEHACAWTALGSIQRGARVTTQVTKETTTQRKFDVGRALLSGGLLLTRQEKKVTERRTETPEPFALAQRDDGEPDIILYERRIDYRFLGREMQSASRGNLELLVRRLRAAAPAALFDDRVARPGFVRSLPATPADPIDLALFLVTLALRLQGRAG